MSEKLLYLQPKLFSFTLNDFTYEVIAVHEYFPDDEGLDFTGNFMLTVLTPRGTIQTVIDAGGDDYVDENDVIGKDVREMILKQIIE